MDFSKLQMITLAIVCCLLPTLFITSTAAQNSGKYTDENRPYEFGFNIEGEQHRKEKKDENGLIMGEFGFITADGVYHVTVYATDENGNFKIISMKNIRLGPAPKGITQPPVVSTVVTTPKPVTLPPRPPPPPQPVRRSEPLIFTTQKPLPIASCSSCSIPSPKVITPPQATFQPPFPSPPQRQNSPFQQQQQQNPQFNQQYQNQNQFNQQGQVQNRFNSQNQQVNQQQFSQLNQNRPPFNQPQNNFNQNQNTFPVANFNQAAVQPQQPQIQRPILISGSIQPVDPSAVIPAPRPGEREGLPPGITVDDMVNLLYRFNYTVGFHGHYEEGYTNGDKKGEYYVNNRNGYATKISYIANDQGYQPKISTVKITPIETPFQETEKGEEFGLKGYEFTWFYVPKYHFLNQQK